MNSKGIVSVAALLFAFIVTGFAQNNMITYGYVEKTNKDKGTTFYAHIILKENQLFMNRLIIYTDSTNEEQARKEIKETYTVTKSELDEISKHFETVLKQNKLSKVKKLKKEKRLLSHDIENKIEVNSKKNLILFGKDIYYLEYNIKLGKEREKMTKKELDEFMKSERLLENISKPIQKLYYKKSRSYNERF